MKYDVDKFYALSEFFNDDFRLIACVISLKIGIEPKRAYKDLEFARYKPEYLDVLEGVQADFKTDPMKPYKEAVLATIPKTDVIFSRDDFANIEAYSVFEKSYDKSGAKLRNKTKRPRRVKKEQLEFKF
nr:MAG TPA: hypothetical protein [Caudoviricetes sp.]